MRYYNLSGPVNRTDVAEDSAKRLQEIFAADGEELVLTYSKTISDRPLYRQPTEGEIIDGTYAQGEYVRTTAEDGIM